MEEILRYKCVNPQYCIIRVKFIALFILFTFVSGYVTENDESDGNISGDPPPDYKHGASKRDIHTINEQRRRDMIKVSMFSGVP